jgi:type IV pilus assembly protein PilN
MIKINLLFRSVEEKEKKANIVRQIGIVLLTVFIFAIILASVHLYIAHRISNLETDIAEKEARLVVLKKIIGEIDDIKAEKKILEKKLAAIKTLEEDRLYPVRLLDEINVLVPARDLWLTKVTESGQQLNIEGVGRNNLVVALFMKNLERASYLQSVELILTKQTEILGVKLQQFSLTCVKRRS